MTSAETGGTETGPERRMTVLQTIGLTRRFGEMTAVNGVDLSVPEGQLRSIIGPNGAGKTTLFNLITGALRPSAGSISFLGEDVTDLSMDARARKGISRAYQITQVFPNLTVEENLRLAEQAKDQSLNPLARPNPAWDVRAEEMFERLDIEGNLDDPVSALSHGEKKKLEVGMSILTEPVILLLDEPTSGLSRDASHYLMEFLGDVAADYTVMLIEHDVDIVLNVSDVITVMHQGRILAEGTPDEIVDDEAVQEAYLGGY